MLGLFCGVKANNNEEYKKVIKAKMNQMIVIFVAGAVTMSVSLLAKFVWAIQIEDRMLGFYTGVGSGLVFVSVILWIKNKAILGDEEKLKKDRLMKTDERNLEISNKAFRIASSILLAIVYLIGLIGGLFSPVLIYVLLSIVCVFLLAYLIAYKYYEKKM